MSDEAHLVAENGEESMPELNYEDYVEFNQSLDDESGPIEIAGTTFSASRILFEMDPVAYRASVVEFLEMEEENFKQDVSSEFPRPIAYCLHRAEWGYENNMQRLLLLRDTWESLIFLLFALVVGECRFWKVPLRETGIKMKDMYSDKLHIKLRVIKSFRDVAHRRGYDLANCKLITDDLLGRIADLNRVRNGFSHEAAKSEGQAQQLFTQYYPDVLSVLRDVMGLRDVVLMRYVSHTDALTLRCETFRGSRMVKEIEDIIIQQSQLADSPRFLNNKTVIVRHNNLIYSLSPFLHFQDNVGQRTDLCFYKRKENNPELMKPSPQYKFEIIGLSQSVYFDRTDFRTEIGELQTLLQQD